MRTGLINNNIIKLVIDRYACKYESLVKEFCCLNFYFSVLLLFILQTFSLLHKQTKIISIQIFSLG